MRALITGITGQDGTYLAEFLLAKSYQVAGTTRDIDAARNALGPLAGRLELLQSSLNDIESLRRLLSRTEPDEIYNLAGQSKVSSSWSDPVGTAEANAVGVLRLLEAVRLELPGARFFQASSCEIFAPSSSPQNEDAALIPTSPYGIAKLHAHLMVRAYREQYGLRVVSGILFNHESPRRDESFVTRKITKAAAEISAGTKRRLELGTLDIRRDWGFAGDYVEGMWKMLQRDVAEDFVLGTGVDHSVRDFCAEAFRVVGLDYRDHVVSDPGLVRRGDVPVRVADATNARTRLGWTPSVSFPDLIRMMVHADTAALRR